MASHNQISDASDTNLIGSRVCQMNHSVPSVLVCVDVDMLVDVVGDDADAEPFTELAPRFKAASTACMSLPLSWHPGQMTVFLCARLATKLEHGLTGRREYAHAWIRTLGEISSLQRIASGKAYGFDNCVGSPTTVPSGRRL